MQSTTMAAEGTRRVGTERRFDRTVEDLGNVVMLEHVNVRVPDQRLATIFYVTGLGLTRDPYLMTGVTNMWINGGRSQFHLPSGNAQVVRGTTGLVIADRAALLIRLESVRELLAGTRFAWTEAADHVAVTCPWGNRIRVHDVGPRFGRMRLGMPYVELEAPRGSADGIARFYSEVLGTAARVESGPDVTAAHAAVGPGQELVYRETDVVHPAFDGHHVAIYLADFSGPWRKLIELGLITEESDQHQYRFIDIVDPATRKVLFTLEHEVRSMRHPMYARPLVNRNPAQTNRVYAPGHEEAAWSLPAAG
jgi:hypothetical protein